jgi:hypothetical protein
MDAKLPTLLCATVALLAGCGSSSATHPATTSRAPKDAADNEGPEHPKKHPALPGHAFHVTLRAVAGANARSTAAVVTLMPAAKQVCWTITLGTGIPQPTAAYIRAGSARAKRGPVIVPLGARYSPRGCTPVGATVINAVEAGPADYYLSISASRGPAAGLRAQL